MKMGHQEGLFRHSVMLLVATQIGNVCTMLFQIVMMRQLSVTEYGVLASMLSLIMITGTPLDALRTVVAHRTALYARRLRLGAIRPYLNAWIVRLAIASAIVVFGGLLGSSGIADFFQLPSRWPVVLTVCIIAGSLFMPLFAGGLQGVQAFSWMATHAQMWPVVRFLAGLLTLILIGRTALAGLTAQSVGVLVSIGFGLYAWRRVVQPSQEPLEEELGGSRYFFLSLLVLTGYAILMNADVSLVKRFFSPEEAGLFAQAATIARSVVFLPMPIAVVMFPKVVSAGGSSGVDRQILYRAILLTAGLIVLSAGLCTWAADLIWRLFTGEMPDAEVRVLVRWIIWAMAPLGLTYLLMNFEIAQGRFRGPVLLAGLAIVYVAAVAVWHDSYAHVLTVMTVITSSSLLIMLGDVAVSIRQGVLNSPRVTDQPA